MIKTNFEKNDLKNLQSYDLSIVIPVYNSDGCISLLTREIISQLQIHLITQYEIILVNDGSCDNSWHLITQLCDENPRIKAINSFRNHGQTNALITGYKNAKGKVIISMDDDFQNPPHEIIKLYDTIKQGYDFVFAIPKERQDRYWKRIQSSVNNHTLHFLCGIPRNIKVSSFFAFTSKVCSYVVEYNGPFPYIAGLILRTTHNGINIDVDHHSRQHGQSNYNLKKLILHYTNGLTNFSVIPLRLVLFLGLFVSTISFCFAIIVILAVILNKDFQSGWPSIVVITCFFSGVILTSLGIIGEYIGKVFSILNQSPQFYIKEKINF